ncbi:MAG TPA: hypothetical protein VHS80_07170 [Chthoniobacterales bacterium]|nr:hypothetical protein [Chthoniobacterales bacterium]
MNKLAGSQIYRCKVVGSFGSAAIGCGMIFEPELFRVDNQSHVAELGIVIILKDDLVFSVG